MLGRTLSRVWGKGKTFWGRFENLKVHRVSLGVQYNDGGCIIIFCHQSIDETQGSTDKTKNKKGHQKSSQNAWLLVWFCWSSLAACGSGEEGGYAADICMFGLCLSLR